MLVTISRPERTLFEASGYRSWQRSIRHVQKDCFEHGIGVWPMIEFLLAALAHLRWCLAGMLLNKTCKVGCAAKVQVCRDVFCRLFCVDQRDLGLMQ